MNKQRREKISHIVEDLNEITERLSKVLAEEEDAYDNMPENLQSSYRAEVAEEAIDSLTEAIDSLEDVQSILEEIC